MVAKSPLLKELGSLEEETGLKCCICLEGYRSHPQKVHCMSIHTPMTLYVHVSLFWTVMTITSVNPMSCPLLRGEPVIIIHANTESSY